MYNVFRRTPGLNSYAPTSSLEIKSCPGQAPASGKATLHTSRRSQEEPDVAHQQLVQGLSVAEVVEAGEVPGSCNLGSYNS